MELPEWAAKYKRQGCEIKIIKGNYYLYERKSIWDPQRKKAKKVSGAYLGRITENGLSAPKKRLEDGVSVKEYGASAYLSDISGDILNGLRKHFPDIAEKIYVTALMRLPGSLPFKRVADAYDRSWLSELYPGLSLSPPSITALLDKLGERRGKISEFMSENSGNSPFILIDGTRITSASGGMDLAQVGSNRQHDYAPQVNLIYIFGLSEDLRPAFYRCVPGNIADVTAFKLTIEDMGGSDCTVVADNGFASVENFNMLDENNLRYIVPLRRNTAEIDRTELSRRENYAEAFNYNRRPITAYIVRKNGYNVIVFCDEKLRADEMSDFIARRERKNDAIESSKRNAGIPLSNIGAEAIGMDELFGTMFIRTNHVELTAKRIYESYKLRAGIEQAFDVLKNTLDADSAYMHDDRGFEAWCFINHISLTLAFRILSKLKSLKLTSLYSLDDFIFYLSGIHKVCIAGQWRTAELNKKTLKFCADLKLYLDGHDT